MLHKMMMTGAMCVVAPGSSVQLLLAVLVMLIYTMTILKTAPYEEDTEDWSSFIACSALTLTTIGGFALITDDPGAPTYETILLSHLLIGINIVCFAIDILIVVVFDCDGLSRCKKICGGKVIETKNEKIDKSNKTKVQPIQEKLSGSGLREWRSEPINTAASKSAGCCPISRCSDCPISKRVLTACVFVLCSLGLCCGLRPR